MPSSPTARDAAEGLAEIEDVLAEHKAGRISGSLAASTIGLKFLKHQGPLLAALRSAGTAGGETQGARPGRAPDGAGLSRVFPPDDRSLCECRIGQCRALTERCREPEA